MPWMRSKEDEDAGGEDVKSEVRVMDKECAGKVVRGVYVLAPRGVYIHRESLGKCGYAVGCPGCVSVIKGTTRQARIEACRKRLETELKDTERVKGAEKRRSEFVEKAMMREDEKRGEKKNKREREEKGGEEAEREEG